MTQAHEEKVRLCTVKSLPNEKPWEGGVHMIRKMVVVALLVALPTFVLSYGCSQKKEAAKKETKIEQKTAPAETTAVDTTVHDTTATK